MAANIATRFREILGCLCIFLIGFGCATNRDQSKVQSFRPGYPDQLRWIHQKLESASLADGISEDEANQLAVCYWSRFGASCGIVDPAQETLDYWKAPAFVGNFPVPAGDILIQKSTGYISWKSGPTLTNWNQLWQ